MNYLRFLRDNARWLAAGMLMSFLSSFGQTYFISIFGGEIRDGFGLTHGAWGGIYMLSTGVSALLMLWAGGLTDRYRVRTLGSAVILGLALACLAMAANTTVWLLPVIILALRFFGQGMASHVGIVAMARWFVATRGKALAVATLGFSIGEASLPLGMVWLKGWADWRWLWVGTALVAVLAIPVLWALLRSERTPQSVATDEPAVGMDGRHWTRAEALGHPLFWAMIPALMLFPAFGTAFWFHQVHFAEVKGWAHLSLVAVFPLGTAAALVSTIWYGWMIDRVGSGRLLPLYLLPLTLGFGLHWYAPTVGWSAAGVILMGIAGGGQATLPAACWAEYFGTRHVGSIKAVVAAVMVLGSAIGPGLSGWLIDIGVAYPLQLLAFAASFLVASLLLILPVRAATARLAPAP
jgi:MFS family permease